MIQAIKIVNFMGEELYMELKKPADTGFLITSITGLTIPKAELAKTSYSNFDGSFFGGVRVGERNIVISIVFYQENNEKLDIEQLRWKLYRYFQPKKELTLYVINEKGTFKTSGYIESNEINIFSSKESAQISIICPDPYFLSENIESTYSISTVTPLFEFPVSIESNPNDICYSIEDNGFGGKDLIINAIYDEIENEGDYEFMIDNNRLNSHYNGFTLSAVRNNRTLRFGNIKNYPSTIINYDGHGETGVLFTIEATGFILGLRLNNVTRKETLIFDDDKLSKIVGNTIQKNDQIIINTEKGSKSCILIRNGKTYNIFNAIVKGSQWIYIQNGENVITYSTISNIENAKITLVCQTKYLGV